MGVSPPKSTHTEIEPQTRYDSMNGENRPRITDELGEFERDVNQLKLKTSWKSPFILIEDFRERTSS